MDILRMGTAVIAAAGMVWVGGSALTHTDPPPPVFISAPPVAAPDAYQCAVHCKVDWHDGDIGATELNLPHLATGKDIGAPTLPSVVYVPTYIHDAPVDTAGTSGQAASVAPRASKGASQGSSAKASSKAPKPAKAGRGRTSTAKAPKQPSTSVTVRDTTSTTAKGTTTHSHSTTTKTTG